MQRGALADGLRSMRPITDEPVPCVALTGPGAKAPCAKSAVRIWPSRRGSERHRARERSRAPGKGRPTGRCAAAPRAECRISTAIRRRTRRDDVDELRARRIAHLAHGLAAEAGKQKGVDGADAELPRARADAIGIDRVEQPFRLGGGEHRIERQTALARTISPCPARAGSRIASRCAGPARTAPASAARRSPVPDDAGFPLRAQADRSPTRRFPVSVAPTARRTLFQISSASCSTHPGFGVDPSATSPARTTPPARRPRGISLSWCPGRSPGSAARPFVLSSSAAATMPARLRPK